MSLLSAIEECSDEDLDVHDVLQKVEAVRQRLRALRTTEKPVESGEEHGDDAGRLCEERWRIRQVVEQRCARVEQEVQLAVAEHMQQLQKKRDLESKKKAPPTAKELIVKMESLRRSLREELDVKLNLSQASLSVPPLATVLKRKNVSTKHSSSMKKASSNLYQQAKSCSKDKQTSQSPMRRDTKAQLSVARTGSFSSPVAAEKGVALPYPRNRLASVYKNLQATSSSGQEEDKQEAEAVIAQEAKKSPNYAVVHLKHAPKHVRRAITHLSSNTLSGINIPPVEAETIISRAVTQRVPTLTVVHLEEEEGQEERPIHEETDRAQIVPVVPEISALEPPDVRPCSALDLSSAEADETPLDNSTSGAEETVQKSASETVVGQLSTIMEVTEDTKSGNSQPNSGAQQQKPADFNSTLDLSEGLLSLSESTFDDTPRNEEIFYPDEIDAIHRRLNSLGSRTSLVIANEVNTVETQTSLVQESSPKNAKDKEQATSHCFKKPKDRDQSCQTEKLASEKKDESLMSFDSSSTAMDTGVEEFSDGQVIRAGVLSDGELSGMMDDNMRQNGQSLDYNMDTESAEDVTLNTKSEGEVSVSK